MTQISRISELPPPNTRGRARSSFVPGEEFGNWTIQDAAYIDEKRQLTLICKCSCGKVKPVLGTTLRTGKSLGCVGCKARHKAKKRGGTLAANGIKKCTRCKQIKSVDDFRKNRKALDGFQSSCAECELDMKFILNYGISLNQYNLLLESQNGNCAICGKHWTEKRRRHAVDHDHATGEVRGLLCSECNGGLGMFADKTELLQNAISYLQRQELQHADSNT